jgi:hypothetical protein
LHVSNLEFTTFGQTYCPLGFGGLSGTPLPTHFRHSHFRKATLMTAD